MRQAGARRQRRGAAIGVAGVGELGGGLECGAEEQRGQILHHRFQRGRECGPQLRSGVGHPTVLDEHSSQSHPRLRQLRVARQRPPVEAFGGLELRRGAVNFRSNHRPRQGPTERLEERRRHRLALGPGEVEEHGVVRAPLHGVPNEARVEELVALAQRDGGPEPAAGEAIGRFRRRHQADHQARQVPVQAEPFDAGAAAIAGVHARGRADHHRRRRRRHQSRHQRHEVGVQHHRAPAAP